MQRSFGKSLLFLLAVSILLALATARTASAQPTESGNKSPVAKAEVADKAKAEDSHQDSKPSSSEQSKHDKPSEKSSDKPAPEKKTGEKSDDQAEKEKKSAKQDDKPKKMAKPYQVELDELKIEIELDGIFVADEMEEVTLRPEVWTRFKVTEAVAHGTHVKKGDVLVRFDDEKIEKEIAEKSLSQLTEELSLTQDEEEFPRKKRLLELAFETTKRRYEQSQADYDYYYSTDRPITVRIAKYRLKSAREQLATAQEELHQLQQMYEADELTEETEEIVLRRQRFAVETAQLSLELGEEGYDYTMNVSLPRNDAAYKTSKAESELAFKQAKSALEIGNTRRSYDMEKKRNARAKSVERHGKLLSDKGLMTLRAPCDGVVYYGKCTQGKWSQISSMKSKLKPFGTVSANTTIMTIVKPGALHIESSLSEKQLRDFKNGLNATIVPTADKELELPGQVTQLNAIPGASNKFSVKLSVDTSQTPTWLVAGLTCNAKVVTYENKQALLIPRDFVQTDEDNEKIKYVMLLDTNEDDEEEPVRRKVKLGRKKNKMVEVLKGLEEGDKIIQEKKKKDDKD